MKVALPTFGGAAAPIELHVVFHHGRAKPVEGRAFFGTPYAPSKDGRSCERPMPGHPRGSACTWPKGFAAWAPLTRARGRQRSQPSPVRKKPAKPCKKAVRANSNQVSVNRRDCWFEHGRDRRRDQTTTGNFADSAVSNPSLHEMVRRRVPKTGRVASASRTRGGGRTRFAQSAGGRRRPLIGVGKAFGLPSLRTVQAVFPHTALQSMVS
jgi:hypothetical protein